ncbi:MAG: hypothetical protein LBS68_01260 [Puniceicoccales bacterium]|nr:hypothetical protein [Puniceicoccales bacterium]
MGTVKFRPDATSLGGLAIASTIAASLALRSAWSEKTETKLLIICKGCFVALLAPLGAAVKLVALGLAIAYLPVALIVTLVGAASGRGALATFKRSYFWLGLVLSGLEALYEKKYMERIPYKAPSNSQPLTLDGIF